MSQPTEIHTLAGAYALDALTEIERAGFARHVAECSSCAQEVAELTETSSRLSAAAWEAPPLRLREKVFAEVARTRQVTSARHERVERQGEVRRWRRWTAAAVAAGVVALGGMGTVWVVQEQRVHDARLAAEQLEQAQAKLGTIVAAGDAKVSTGTAEGGGRVTVAVSRSLDDAVVLVDGMPATADGKVYQLWLLDSSLNATSIGVMADGQRNGAVAVKGLGRANSVGVTVEPSGGSAKPTATPIAKVNFA